MIRTIIEPEYKALLDNLKKRVPGTRYKVALQINAELILLYYHIGTHILQAQAKHGWGTKIIDQLSKDLQSEFPEMKGFSTQNLKYMRRFAEEYGGQPIVQQLVDQFDNNAIAKQSVSQWPWGHIIALIYSVPNKEEREVYIRHIKLSSFVVIELKNGKFKPEYAGKMNFYLSAVDRLVRQPSDNPSIGLILCRSKAGVVAEYALRDMTKPIGLAEYKFTQSLPKNLKTALPTIEELETELARDFTSQKG